MTRRLDDSFPRRLEWCASDLKRALQLELVGTDAAARKAVLAEWPSTERLRLMRELACVSGVLASSLVQLIRHQRRSALEYLHSGDAIAGGIACIHRDLKPDNIGLSASKKIKLFDFGLAVAVKREGEDGDDGVYELTGGTGSRRYMAPEVCLRENYGTKVDVYSWAIAARGGVQPAPLYATVATHRSIPIAGQSAPQDEHPRRFR